MNEDLYDEQPQVVTMPIFRFSFWDTVGIALSVAGGVAGTINQGFNLAAHQCSAMANWKRQNWDLQQAQREHLAAQARIGQDLAKLVNGEDVS